MSALLVASLLSQILNFEYLEKEKHSLVTTFNSQTNNQMLFVGLIDNTSFVIVISCDDSCYNIL